MDVATTLFNKLFSIAKHQEKDVYYWEMSYNGNTEKYYISNRGIWDVAEEIVNGHPAYIQYRNARNKLHEASRKTLITDTYVSNQNNNEEFRKCCDEMLDLNIYPDFVKYAKWLQKIGDNPTKSFEKFDNDLILNKSWRTKKDYVNKKPMNRIKNEIISEILANPSKAIMNNPYVFSVISEFAIKK